MGDQVGAEATITVCFSVSTGRISESCFSVCSFILQYFCDWEQQWNKICDITYLSLGLRAAVGGVAISCGWMMTFQKFLYLLYYMHVYLQMDTCFDNYNHLSIAPLSMQSTCTLLGEGSFSMMYAYCTQVQLC